MTVGEMNNFDDYNKRILGSIDGILKGRNKISKREFLSVFSEQISKLSDVGRERLEDITNMDKDSTTVSREEISAFYALMDLDLSGEANEELDAENSLLNTADDRKYKDALEYIQAASKPIKQKDNKDIKININMEHLSISEPLNLVDKDDYTLEELKKKYPEPRYTVSENEPLIVGLPPTILVKDNTTGSFMRVSVDEEDVDIYMVENDEYGNVKQKVFTTNGVITSVSENSYVYDEQGNKLFAIYEEDGKVTGSEQYEYDEFNNVTVHISYDANGRQIRQECTQYKYYDDYYILDEDGNKKYIGECDIYDTQEEADDARSYGLEAYLKSGVQCETNFVESGSRVFDSNGVLIEEECSTVYNEYYEEIAPAIENHSPLADDLYTAISSKTSIGIPKTDMKLLKDTVEKLNASNINTVLYHYKQKSGGKTLLEDLQKEYGAKLFQSDEMDEIINKVRGLVLENANTSDVAKVFLDEISGNPNVEVITEILNKVHDRHLIFTFENEVAEQSGKSLIQNIMDKYLTVSKEKRLEFIKFVIEEHLYEITGVDDIRQKIYDELDKQANKFGFMNSSKIEELLDSVPLFKNGRTKDPNMPNGKIDQPFSQAYNGDCWLISSIKAISLTPNADKCFGEILKINSDGNYEVKLRGIDKPFVVTNRDIQLGGFLNSANGDGDVKVLEKAFEQYLIANGENPEEALDGNNIFIAFHLLVGEDKTRLFLAEDLSLSLINREFSNLNNAIIVSRYDNEHSVNSALNSKGQEVPLLDPHGFTVSRIDNEFVYIIDPNLGNEELHIKKEDFQKAFDACAIATI